jgi:hypothetical protein
MSDVYADVLMDICGEALDIAYDLMEAYTSTYVEKDLQNAADKLKISIESNNYEDAHNIFLPELTRKNREYAIALSNQSQEHFYTEYPEVM